MFKVTRTLRAQSGLSRELFLDQPGLFRDAVRLADTFFFFFFSSLNVALPLCAPVELQKDTFKCNVGCYVPPQTPPTLTETLEWRDFEMMLNATTSSQAANGLSGGAIAAAVLVPLFVLVAAVGVVVFLVFRQRSANAEVPPARAPAAAAANEKELQIVDEFASARFDVAPSSPTVMAPSVLDDSSEE